MARKNGRRKNFKRADGPEEKDERRQLILRAAAEELSLVTSVDDFTINALARRIGLAKGTIYLYFKSKGAILMELLGDAVESLTLDIISRFSELPEPVSAPQAARTMRDCLKKSADTWRLSLLLKTLSDKDEESSQLKHYERIEPFLRQADAIIVQRLSGLRPGEGRKIIRFGWALLMGLSEMASAKNRHTPVPINVEQDLKEALTVMIAGLVARSR
jgi:AcrR family transcriptional regulator